MTLVEAMGVWCLFVLVAFACRLYCAGGLEERLGEWRSHLLFVVMTSVLVFAIGTVALSGGPVAVGLSPWQLGGVWLMLSFSFELFLGRYILGLEWRYLFRDYNLRRGRLYPLVLLTVFFTPSGSYYLLY